MIHQVAAHLVAAITQSIWKSWWNRIEQYVCSGYCWCIEKNNFCKELFRFVCLGINDLNTGGSLFLFIINNFVHHWMRSHRKIAGGISCRHRTCIGTEVGAPGATTMTKITDLALPSSFYRLGKIGYPVHDNMPVFIFWFYLLFEILFNGIHFKWRQKFSIGQCANTVCITTYTNEWFNIIIPRCNVFISYGPIHPNTIFEILFEIKITPVIAGPSP